MAMATSEIDQVITLIDRSRNEVSTILEESIDSNSRMLREELEGQIKESHSNLFKVMFIVTALVQIEIVATAWWLVSH